MAARVARGGDKPSLAASKVLAAIREATGASDEDIAAMLALCGGDANEATEKLLTNPFERVKTKQEKRREAEEARRKEAEAARKLEAARRAAQSTASAGRGGYRDDFGRGKAGTGCRRGARLSAAAAD
ncbi:hypothetical protein MNEG_11680 [Monoraphidium neglectum]|uniref:GBF-interacting protein 1 N-terminal domain-containing protein n=1 Tax=Monoraphidium neglectum TaxID=145388 RepID=A0A0D2KKE6_9CHLO|nr:hypothetical protein MNEG_11680 [Monoraphidium neglectum]KIY96283.1 hypothetical protein MNEG_11680 [Monoraphidium neglectum]|eukprot:XP_013895303.1 hypothetical protein MNEG_11680 [Monoraphidium neglectum]